MCVQQAVSDGYASATGAQASGTSCSNAIGIKALQPDPTRPDGSGRVRIGSGLNYLLSGEVGLNFRLSCSPLIGMVLDLRTRKSERSQR